MIKYKIFFNTYSFYGPNLIGNQMIALYIFIGIATNCTSYVISKTIMAIFNFIKYSHKDNNYIINMLW